MDEDRAPGGRSEPVPDQRAGQPIEDRPGQTVAITFKEESA